MISVGIGLSFALAATKSSQGVFNKWSVDGTNEYITAWCMRAIALLAIVPAFAYTGIPELDDSVWYYMLVGGSLNAVATVLTMKAFRKSDVSLIVPIFAVGPALILLTSPFILGEFPSLVGLFGVLVVVSGAYATKVESSTTLIEPITSLASDRGVQLAFLVNVIHSITSNVDKLGVQSSSPVFWVLINYVFLTIVLFPPMILTSDSLSKQVKVNLKPLLGMGLLSGVSIIIQMTAISLTLVVYVTSIKRLSIVATPFLAYYLLDEKEEIRGRVAGSILVIVGVTLITVS